MDGTILEKKLGIAEKLAQLNEIAQKVDDMPTFTSDDRAFLAGLPGFPTEDGKKVLTATTESGETSLDYEEVEAGAVNYSTSEQATGQKWIDGKDIYFKTVVLDEVLSIPTASTWTDSGIDTTDVDYIVRADVRDANGVNFAVNVAKQLGDVKHLGIMQFRNAQIGVQVVTLFYTKVIVTTKKTRKKTDE